LAYPLGALADRLGPGRATRMAMAYYGLLFFAWAAARGLGVGLGLLLGYAVFIALFEPARRAYLAEVAPKTERAGAIGLFHALEGALLFPASAVFGTLWQNFGAEAAFALSGALALLGAALLPGRVER